jgi:hypothetical protein
VPIHQGPVDLEAMFSFNETGARIWELIDGKKRGSEIAELISKEFSHEKEQAQKDLLEFMAKLKKLNFIIEVK